MAECEPTTRLIFIRNGESNPDSGGENGLDYQLTEQGRRRAELIGSYLPDMLYTGRDPDERLRAILDWPKIRAEHLAYPGRYFVDRFQPASVSPDELPLLTFLHDGTRRAMDTMTVASGLGGFRGGLDAESVFNSDGGVEIAEVRARIMGWIAREHAEMDYERVNKLRKFDNGWRIEGALGGLCIVVATSQKTVASLAAQRLGVSDDEIRSEHPMDGGFTDSHPYIPFGSVTEFAYNSQGLTLVHAGIDPRSAAIWATSSARLRPEAKRPYHGKPADVTNYQGKRYWNQPAA